METSLTSLKDRKAWFETNLTRLIVEGAPGVPNVNFVCPCCAYPTLNERAAWEICPLCSWEDDGQDDPEADEIWGGPNHEYSLTAARINFERYRVMYAPENDPRIGGADRRSATRIKQSIVASFEAMRLPNANTKRLWREVSKGFGALDRELNRRIGFRRLL